VVGDILGAGIYALTGTVAAQVGGAIWLPFLLAFALATLTATAYAELVARYPKAAGAALYANRAFRRPFLTFLVAFAVMMSGITSASAAARAFGGDYLAELLPFGVPTLVAAWVFLGLITVVNVLGVSESVRVNVVLTLVEASGLLVIIGIGVWALAHGDGDPSRALDLHTDGPAWMGVLGGTALAFYALLGFEDSVNLAEEARHPRRDFPRALFGGLAVAGAIYLAVAFTASMLVETDVLVGSTGPLLEVVRVAGAVPPGLFAVVALVAVANGALLTMIMASRLAYGMAQQGLLPPVLGRVLPGRRTPGVAIAVTTAVAMVLAATGELVDLASTVVLLLLFVFLSTNVAVLVLRRDRVEHPHFRAWTPLPVLAAATCLGLLTQQEARHWALAGVLMAVGLVLYLVTRRFSRPVPSGE